MAIRFIHTSDWQIGKVFRFVDVETMGLLQEARLAAITRLGEIAKQQEIGHVLVAGDVYDMENLSTRSLNQPLERMRGFDQVLWHLLPGNHDPQRLNGLWDRLMKRGVPNNVKIHTESKPTLFDKESMAILPAPLHHKRSFHDTTEYMTEVNLPSRISRIGLAHGSVTRFGSGDQNTANYIDPSRPQSANLSYLALGDWHGQKQINSRCWYSGTPETDAFDVENGGKALIVKIAAAAAPPEVISIKTGSYSWRRLSDQINNQNDIDMLEQKLRQLSDSLDRVLIDLTVEGALSLEDRNWFHERIVEQTAAAFCHVRVHSQQLLPQPTAEDLNRIDTSGFVRIAAENLKNLSETGSEDEKSLASEALQRLYLELMKEEALSS